jgi:transcriptional regulator with XRE-family HTH domain
MPKTYANRIRAIRRLRGWRLADLALRLDCDASDLGKWERGEREPTLRSALRIAQLLGERVEDIFWDHFHDAWGRLRAVHDQPSRAQAPSEDLPRA